MSAEKEWHARAKAIEFDARAVVNGQRIHSASTDVIECVAPANGETLYELPVGSSADVDAAVCAARRVFDEGHWANIAPMIRKAILIGFADLIDTNQEQLALLDSVEMGKTISQAHEDVAGAAHILRYYAEFADKAFGRTAPTAPPLVQYTRREPRGVVAAIVPWNYPIPNAALKVAPALAAGNSVVLKPSELSSSSALRFAELAVEAGVPPGTFNVVPGSGTTVGAALAAHPGVDFIAFTGSTETGKALLAAAGQNSMKPLQLECGGKSANIVFEDCTDLDVVAQDAAQRIFGNQGQLCVAGTRLIAHESVKKALVERVVQCARELVIGDPLDPAITFGPLASRARKNAVLSYCRRGRNSNASLRYGGGEALPESGGCFVEPTVFDDVDPSSPLAQEDIFGPVLSVFSFSDCEEAIALANNSAYGLSATVWTKDLSTANAAVRRLRVGRVTVMASAPDPSAFAFPMGSEPVGQSGFGAEGGGEGFEVYTRLKAVEMHG